MSLTLELTPEKYNNLSPKDIVRRFVPEITTFREQKRDSKGNYFYLKDETDNPTGAYKWRGSAVKLSRLFSDGVGKVVTASAGNHGQGVAWVSGQMGGCAEVFVPVGTPASKLEGLNRLGATVYQVGSNFDESTSLAIDYAKSQGNHFVHPYDDIDVMDGQGTIADELYLQMKSNGIYAQDSVVFVPVGGGGLIGGEAKRLKQLTNNEVKVVGVQVEGSDSAALSFYDSLDCADQKIDGAYRILLENRSTKSTSYVRTKATSPNNNVDGTRVNIVGKNCMDSIIKNVDEFLVISSESLGSFYKQNPSTRLEPAGALAQVGADLYSCLPGTQLQYLISLQTGRNQDKNRIQNLIDL